MASTSRNTQHVGKARGRPQLRPDKQDRAWFAVIDDEDDGEIQGGLALLVTEFCGVLTLRPQTL